MTFGVHTVATDETIQPAKLGRALEERGFDAVFLADHSHIPVNLTTPYPGGGDIPRQYYRTLDPVVTLGVLAGVTSKLLLGTGTALPVQRDPIQTAKDVATLDHVSGGRVLFGVGVGWLREEIRDHGTDPRTRGALMDERLAAIIEIWTKEQAEFHGKFVNFDPIFAWPKPVRRPHPPVYVGGQSEKALARAKRFGGWLPISVTEPEQVAGMIARAEGVPVIALHVPPTPDMVAAYRDAGAAGVVFHLPFVPETEAMRMIDEFTRLIG